MKHKKVIFVGKRATCREPMAMALLQRELPPCPVEICARGLVVLFEEPMNPKAEEVLAANGIFLPDYRACQLAPEDFSEDTLVVTFHQDIKEKLLEMEGAQNIVVLTDVTGDELEIMDPYGGELLQYEICLETLGNSIRKLAQRLQNDMDEYGLICEK